MGHGRPRAARFPPANQRAAAHRWVDPNTLLTDRGCPAEARLWGVPQSVPPACYIDSHR